MDRTSDFGSENVGSIPTGGFKYEANRTGVRYLLDTEGVAGSSPAMYEVPMLFVRGVRRDSACISVGRDQKTVHRITCLPFARYRSTARTHGCQP